VLVLLVLSVEGPQSSLFRCLLDRIEAEAKGPGLDHRTQAASGRKKNRGPDIREG